jgi:ABC-2 type transport system permease protein
VAEVVVPPRAGGLLGALRLYCRLVGAEVRATLEYPASFAVASITALAITGLDLVAVAAVFANVDALSGWTLAEVLLLYGMAQTSFYLADLGVGQLDALPDLVRTGRLDILLLRPRRVLFQIVAADVDLRGVGKIAQAVFVLALGLSRADVALTPATVALLVVAIASGAVIYAAIWIGTTSITFWLVDSREVSSAFTYGGRQMSTYPLGIYSAWVRHIVRLAIPIAFTAYFPTLGLLGREDPLGWPSWMAWAGPLVAVVLAVWSTGVRAYRSTGA